MTGQDPMTAYGVEIFKTALSLLVAAVTLAATWFIGQGLIVRWNLRQKRDELNQASLQAFYALYGEFKEVVKIWRLAKRPLKSSVVIPPDERWKLLTRACAIESKSESLVLRLTSERSLPDDALEMLGMFRQAIQTLRESIRDDVDCALGSRRTEYRLLNRLAPDVAVLAAQDLPKTPPSVQQAQRQLAQVVAVTSARWKQRVSEYQRQMTAEEIAEKDEDA